MEEKEILQQIKDTLTQTIQERKREKERQEMIAWNQVLNENLLEGLKEVITNQYKNTTE